MMQIGDSWSATSPVEAVAAAAVNKTNFPNLTDISFIIIVVIVQQQQQQEHQLQNK